MFSLNASYTINAYYAVHHTSVVVWLHISVIVLHFMNNDMKFLHHISIGV